MDCEICFNIRNDKQVKLRCGNIFHIKCILERIKECRDVNFYCPICKKKLNQQDHRYIQTNGSGDYIVTDSKIRKLWKERQYAKYVYKIQLEKYVMALQFNNSVHIYSWENKIKTYRDNFERIDKEYENEIKKKYNKKNT